MAIDVRKGIYTALTAFASEVLSLGVRNREVMSRVLRCFLLVAPALLSATPVLSSAGNATEVQQKAEHISKQANQDSSPTTLPAIPQAKSNQYNQEPQEERHSTRFSFEERGEESVLRSSPSLLFPERTPSSHSPLVHQAIINNEPATLAQLEPSTRETTLSADSASSPDSELLHLESDPIGQVTSVTQLSDVRPTDWAFEALRSLVERYGCIAGYPDGTFRGNRSLTRYEFAAGLNACLDQINKLIGANGENLVRKQDIAALQKLQEEFAGELSTLRGRVDTLEARTTRLEDHQFSTTTRLNVEVVAGVNSILTGDRANGQSAPRIPVLNDRVRLNFDSSFFGKDRLRVRLQANNVVPYNTVLQTFEGRVNYDGNSNNNVTASLIQYRLPAQF
jgi:hypothetical protein